MSSSYRRDRSRSPMNIENGDSNRNNQMDTMGNNALMVNNQMGNNMGNMNTMMMNNMYQQGNMVMPGMYQNMMMPNQMSQMMTGGMMQSGMDMMGQTTGLEMMPQQSMDVAPLPQPPLPPVPPNNTSDINMMGGMMMDPSMMNMGNMGTMANMGNLGNITNMGNMGNMGMGSNMVMFQNMGGEMMEKKELVLKYCKLSPPEPGTPAPPQRPKPLGCRTIFVGGLPDKIRESIVRDIFERYGRIHTLRLSKKNFCHIRFDRESAVDAAMFLSGYRIKLIEKDSEKDKDQDDEDSPATTGWLHVDYALSRDDQNEYERRQRHALRVQQQQMEQMTSQQDVMMSMPDQRVGRGRTRRSPSPPKLMPFSNILIVQIMEKIKSEEHFSTTIPTLLAWLERGECSKKNSNQFYSMIQATNSHIRRLFNEKMQAEEELQECKERVKTNIERVIDLLEQVSKVFNAATHKRVWDHFTKPQRKNIETWQKMTQEFGALKEEFKERFEIEEYDMNNSQANNMMMMNRGDNNEELQQLRRENESLQFQLEAYKNEVDVIKSEAKSEMEKFKAQFIARQALKETLPPLPAPVEKPPPPPPLPEQTDSKVNLSSEVEAGCGEAKLIGVMSAFLQVHPNGASLDYVVSYVRALFPRVSQAAVHGVLQKHADVFQRSTSGVGANIEHRWMFVGFRQD